MSIRFLMNNSPLPGLGHSCLSGQFGQGMVNLILTQLKPSTHSSFQLSGVRSFPNYRDPT
jgi:hypothetical protein